MTEEVLVEPGQLVTQGETIAVLRTATGKVIGLKSPRNARIGEHIMPSGTQILEQGFFAQMHAVGAGDEGQATTEPERAPEPRISQTASEPPKLGMKADAVLALVLPVLCMLPTVILAELVFPDFFEETIWLRWLMILAGVIGGIYWASAQASTPVGTRNVLATVSTVSVCIIAMPLMFPLDFVVADMDWMSEFSPGDLFKTKVAGVVLDDLRTYSNGTTPSPSYDLVQDFDRWLND
jgi:hypothetical protein